ncbi:non-muscle cofilin 1-like [Pseudorasbora parva]|uniref:non-muscle cofilin 1-like n=1 Tax=Pseudorasbora parva TaxID=51549 RepID=UPI00351F3A8B
MASGVAISDEVIHYYDSIRVRLQGTSEQERLKFVLMRVSADQKSIIVDQENCLRVKDVENTGDIFKTIISKLPSNECRYALYDCSYMNRESVKEDLVFIISAPEDAPMRNKMLYASSKSALKAKMPGLKFEWQINDHTDRDISSLVEKLGGRSVVKSLEGKSV